MKRIARHLSLVFFFLGIHAGLAQRLENPFKLLQGKRQIIYGFDNRRTHISGERAVIYGAYSGIGFSDKKLRFKIGLNGAPFELGKTMDPHGNLKLNRFFFVSVGEEVDFFRAKRFCFSTYFQVGYGYNYFSRIHSLSGMEIESGRDLMIPLETGIQVGYDLSDWLAVKAGGGWRFVFPSATNDLAGYYLKVGVSADIRQMLIHRRKSTHLKQIQKPEKEKITSPVSW